MSAETSIRRRLGYRPWSCKLCPVSFFSQTDAENHFHPAFSRHPGHPVTVSQARDPAMEQRVREALGGSEVGSSSLEEGARCTAGPSGQGEPEHKPINAALPTTDEPEDLLCAEQPKPRQGLPEVNADEPAQGQDQPDLSCQACALCSAKVAPTKRAQLNHASVRHMGTPRIRCKACPKSFATREAAACHIRSSHHAERWEELCSFRKDPEGEESAFQSCFPSSKAPYSESKRCAECPGLRLKSYLSHVSACHYRTTLIRCSLCPFGVQDWGKVHTVKRHVRLNHAAAKVVDERPRHREAVVRLAKRLIIGSNDFRRVLSGTIGTTKDGHNEEGFEEAALQCAPESGDGKAQDKDGEDETKDVSSEEDLGDDFKFENNTVKSELPDALEEEAQEPTPELADEAATLAPSASSCGSGPNESYKSHGAPKKETVDRSDGVQTTPVTDAKETRVESPPDRQAKLANGITSFNESASAEEDRGDPNKVMNVAVKSELPEEEEEEEEEEEPERKPNLTSSAFAPQNPGKAIESADNEELLDEVSVNLEIKQNIEPLAEAKNKSFDEGLLETHAIDEPTNGEKEKTDAVVDENSHVPKDNIQSHETIACAKCGKVVRNRYINARAHVLYIHTEMDISCTECDATFGSRSTQLTHYSAKHPGNIPPKVPHSKVEHRARMRECFRDGILALATEKRECGGCGQSLSPPFLNHVASHHYRRPLWACPVQSCDWATHGLTYGKDGVARHLKREHSQAESSVREGKWEPVDLRAEHKAALEELTTRLFPPKASESAIKIDEDWKMELPAATTKQRQVRCGLCQGLVTLGHRRGHVAKRHSGGERFGCPHCEERFADARLAAHHLGDKHGIAGGTAKMTSIEQDPEELAIKFKLCFPDDVTTEK